MSFREEDKEKEKGGLGTGFAVAAAIGVGLGAALYYFINKRTENPTAAGSTAQGWTCESPHTFRERSWTLEECSICFEVILRDQEIMSLPCTHNFHTKCILPWLQEQQTCPNCRKSVD
ncbi:probable E3 ubiquitin-protein ligase RHY1A isoform X2 [Vanessa cardui]|uniref:probable E3 ubiquitin-protein ligase RHY1A isoform X2 n=1 Tax=Vanessa cardui TaxID=171605 RepID=UPI001F130D3C|nr:probable E3 ubiquitin-protein ligase RHY1A isoform X2 [Vanessa cardui]